MDYEEIKYMPSAEEAYKIVNKMLAPLDEEYFVMVTFSEEGKVRNYYMIDKNDERKSRFANLSDFMGIALHSKVENIMIFINYIDERQLPTKEDIKLAKMFKSVCETMDIEFIDYVVFNRGNVGCRSYREAEDEWCNWDELLSKMPKR